MAKVPWWAKIGAKLVLSRLPFGYRVWQRVGLFRHGAMDSSEYAIRVFESHMDRCGLIEDLAGKTVLELGPGDGAATGVLAAAHGARAILVDQGRFIRDDVKPYALLGEALRTRGHDVPELSTCGTSDNVLARCDATYLANGLASLRGLGAGTVDVVFSQAVLEHVRRHEFLDTMRELRRVLKPGSLASHQVDFRDHLGGQLNNLRFGNKVWESGFFAKSGFYTNRIRFSEMLQLCRQGGFEVVSVRVKQWETVPTPRAKISPEFRSLSDEDLRTWSADLLLRAA